MEKLMAIFEGFDIEKLGDKLPSAESLMNGLTGWIRPLVLVGPLLMLGFGIYYWFFAPKEANHSMGFRFSYAMSRVEVWQHAQRLAGMAYTALGGILFVIIGLISLRFGRLVAPDMVWLAAKCLLWEVVLSIVVTLAVYIMIVVLYDIHGEPRKPVKTTGKTRRPSPTGTRRK